MSGALAGLQSELAALKSPMKRIPLPLESYQHPSPGLDNKRLVNMMAEHAPNDARTSGALIPTHGLAVATDTFGAGPIVAMNTDQPGLMYVASQGELWRMTQPFGGPRVIEDLGTIGTPSGADYSFDLMTTIAVGVNACVVCVPPNAFTCAHTGALNQIGGSFPGAKSVAYLDGYFVFTANNNDSQFFSSKLLDPTMFDALDFAFADGVPNVLRRVVTLADELWFAGDSAMEVWYNAGAADFAFRRRAGGVIPYGTVAMKSMAVIDGSLFWLSTNGVIMRSNGYSALRVSTHAIEALILGAGILSIASAIGYSYRGHNFYCITFANDTFVYDCSTKFWHERSSSADGSAPWMVSAVAVSGAETVFGTTASGRTFNPAEIDTDDGASVIRQLITPGLYAGTYRASCHRLEIEMETGGATPTGSVLLQWSDDEGLTWSAGRTMTAGTTSGYRGRVYTTRLGSFRQRMFKVTMQHRATIYAIDCDIPATAGG